MTKRSFILLSLLPVWAVAQNDTTGRQKDSLLEEVTVTAFQSHQHWKAVPAAVALLSAADLMRYGNLTMVPVFNMVPGVRIEERSPASYRLSLRGSLLRSPFGVRNVKVYWNDVPLTDGGGNTYLNLVDLSQLTSAEVLKGPVASVYGAGTGGALLLHSGLLFSDKKIHSGYIGTTGGAYGLFSEQAGWQYQEKNFATSLQQTHQQSDGYRQQSASRKDVVKWQANTQWNHQQLQALFFYTDLYYQTPGGLTLAQMQADPRAARPAAGAIPGSVTQKAAIYNQTLFGAVHHTAELGKYFSLQSFVTGNHTNFTNPFITNYERRSEDNFGTGTNLVLHLSSAHTSVQWMNGVEWLYNRSTISDYGNRAGVQDTLQFSDNAFSNQWFAFSQARLVINDRWTFTAGLSINGQSYRYKRISDITSNYVLKNISAVVTPRFAALYRVTKDVSLYAVAAKGFSPPSLAEIRPSDGNYYGDLNAEYGWNYEGGIKGTLAGNRLEFDLAAYHFSLQQAIVRRSNAAGAEYFVNAGGTVQKGIEALIRYQLFRSTIKFITSLKIWSSYSYQPYRFSSYQQTGIDYSGNALTGVPKNIWVSGVDLDTKIGLYLQTSVNSVSTIPLTDANDAYAAAYQLVQAQIGYRKNRVHVFMGIDNLLDQTYSLGNDINAVGKRYYNPAGGRSLFAGIRYRL